MCCLSCLTFQDHLSSTTLLTQRALSSETSTMTLLYLPKVNCRLASLKGFTVKTLKLLMWMTSNNSTSILTTDLTSLRPQVSKFTFIGSYFILLIFEFKTLYVLLEFSNFLLHSFQTDTSYRFYTLIHAHCHIVSLAD